MVIGYALMGVFSPLTIVFNIPVMIECVEFLHPKLNKTEKALITDFSASIFTTVQFLFESIAPMYATYVTQQVSHRQSVDFVAFGCFGFGLLYWSLTKDLS